MLHTNKPKFIKKRIVCVLGMNKMLQPPTRVGTCAHCQYRGIPSDILQLLEAFLTQRVNNKKLKWNKFGIIQNAPLWFLVPSSYGRQFGVLIVEIMECHKLGLCVCVLFSFLTPVETKALLPPQPQPLPYSSPVNGAWGHTRDAVSTFLFVPCLLAVVPFSLLLGSDDEKQGFFWHWLGTGPST